MIFVDFLAEASLFTIWNTISPAFATLIRIVIHTMLTTPKLWMIIAAFWFAHHFLAICKIYYKKIKIKIKQNKEKP